jgi:hypothetical protein
MEAQMLKLLGQQIPSGEPSGEKSMAKLVKNALLESVPMLVLLGLLAGAVGGLGIGLIQMKAASSATSSSK